MGVEVCLGDLFDVLPTLPEASIDACVTDPPYGIGFMGKEWDTFDPGAAEERNVPARRMDHPNPNMRGRSRAVASSPSAVEYDRSLGGQRGFQDWSERWAREVYRVLKPGAYLLVCGAPRSYHRMACGIEDAGFEIRDCFAWLFGQGFPKSLNFEDGWGTGLKPANEPIVIARKPFKGSVEKNREQHGTGAINIKGCRIDGVKPQLVAIKSANRKNPILHTTSATNTGAMTDEGRWPSNVLLDELAAAMLDEQTGELVSGANPTRRHSDKLRNVYGAFAGQAVCEPARGVDVGGASRFFYVAKPDRAERDRGCLHLTPRQRDESRKAGNPGGVNPRNRGLQPRGNFHPTVKPLDLMRWLVRLVTPNGGTVLDPFTGSGTTGMACVYEGVSCIGIEREAAYVELAQARIADCLPLLSEANALG